MRNPANHLYEFGPYRLDPQESVLLREGHPVPLAPKVLQTLFILVRRHGHVVGKDELIAELWPETFVEEANLTQNIFTIRKALGESGQKYIETVPRRGYRFTAPVHELWDAEDDFITVQQRTGPSIVIEEAIGTGAATRSIAVLPFKFLGADGSDEYLGLGIADALITKLTNVRHIIVRPTSAVLRYGGLKSDSIAVGQELRVELVLEGSVQRQADRIRVTVQIVSLKDEAPVWAGKFDAQFTDLFSIEDSISEQVTQALTVKLTSEERWRLSKHYTENTEAYQLYLKGRYFWNNWTEGGLKKAIEYFQQAIDKDPSYALAYAGLADSYGLLGEYGVLPPNDAQLRAKAAAMKALGIDETLAEAHALLGLLKEDYEWDQVGAEREFKRAIELKPNYATAHFYYAMYLGRVSRFDESMIEMNQALELDPLSLTINSQLGRLLISMRQYDESIEQLQRTLEMDPNYGAAHAILALAYERKGLYEEAIAACQQGVVCLGRNPVIVAWFGIICAMAGHRDEALKVLDELQEMAIRCYISPYFIASIHAALGDKDQMFEWLEKAHKGHATHLVYLLIDPWFDNFRSDPRMTELIRRIGLTLWAS